MQWASGGEAAAATGEEGLRQRKETGSVTLHALVAMEFALWH